MKLAIILHTQSGRTAELARKIAEVFRNAGHEVDISMLRTVGTVSPGSSKFEIKNAPEITDEDWIIFAAPVWAFKASPVIMKYLGTLKNLKGKKVVNIITKSLPFDWTGGTQALVAMNSEVETSNGDALQGEIVQSFAKASAEKLTEIAKRVLNTFTA
jgi:flavodoxin